MDGISIKAGDTIRRRENGRMVTYHVRKGNWISGLIEGAVLNDDEFLTSWFVMTFGVWEEMKQQPPWPTR